MQPASNRIGEKLKRVVRAGVYARYSSEMQSSSSATDQIDRIRYLTEKGQIATRMYANCRIEILSEWIQKDEAFTGRVAGRQGYQNILNGIRSKSFELLLVDDLSRLTRSLGNLLDLYQLLNHHDVELVSISDRLSSADPNSRTFFTVKGMVADFGNEAHSERTIRGLEARARDMFSTGQRPYGYGSEATREEIRKGRKYFSHYKILIIPQEAEVVRRVFQLYIDGFGKYAIAKKLNRDKIPLRHQSQSKEWKDGPIHKMLHNEKYIGRWVFRKNYYSLDPDTGMRVQKPRPREQWIENTREDLRIIPQDLWDRVQRKLQENKIVRRKSVADSSKKDIFCGRNRVDNVHLLSSVMTCAECKGVMILVSGRRDGYYGCVHAHRYGNCQNRKLIRRKRVEQAFLKYLDESVAKNPTVIQYATDNVNSAVKEYLRRFPTRREALESELEALNKEVSHLVDFISSGQVSDAVAGKLKEKEARKAQVTEELDRIIYAEARQQKLLITPYLVREQLQNMVTMLAERGERYNAVVKDIFIGGLEFSEENGKQSLRGRMDLGKVLSRTPVRGGSTHYTSASPTGVEPVS